MQKAQEVLKNARIDKGLTQEAIAADIGISMRMYQRYEDGLFPKYKSENIKKLDQLLGINISDIIYDSNVPRNTFQEEDKNYLEKRRSIKSGKESPAAIPAYVGNTKMGKFEAYADDPEMQTPAGYFDSQIFPGCNHAEKVSGDSMYPLIVNQGWIIGKIIDKTGIISGEKYCLHLRSGQNIVKYVHWDNKKKDLIKIISHNKKVPEDVIPINDITFCVRVYFIINPT